jgi:hypothetical protein
MLTSVYMACVHSVLSYGIIGWGGAGKSVLTPLRQVQKCILKVMFNKPTRFPTNIIFDIAKVLDTNQIYYRNLLLHCHKNRTKFYTSKSNIHNTRATNKLALPLKRKLKGQQHADFLGPRCFNKLPIDIASVTRKDIFKKLINSYIRNLGRDACAKHIYFQS